MIGDNIFIYFYGINCCDFMKFCAVLVVIMGLSSKVAVEMVELVINLQCLLVIWIGVQECIGCMEFLFCVMYLMVENFVLEIIFLEYYEVFFVVFGYQVEENKYNVFEKYKGQYVLVVDGFILLKDNGIYCMVVGELIVDYICKAVEGAAVIIVIGFCFVWGGVVAVGVNLIGAVSL